MTGVGGSEWGREGNTLVMQSELEPPSQSGEILVTQRRGCGVCFPTNWVSHTLRRSRCQKSSASFQHTIFSPATLSSVWELCHFPSFIYTHFHTFVLIPSLIFPSPVWSRPSITVPSLLFTLFCVLSNLHLFQPWASITNFSSRFCLSVDGFEVCCEMCGWGKKNLFSVKKKKR